MTKLPALPVWRIALAIGLVITTLVLRLVDKDAFTDLALIVRALVMALLGV